MGKVVRFYKPCKGGKKLHVERVIHKLEVLKALTESWTVQYGAEFVEFVA